MRIKILNFSNIYIYYIKIMKKIFVLFSLIFILSSCSIDWNWEKDKKIAELGKQVSEFKKAQENDLFERNKECYQLTNEIKSDLESEEWFMKVTEIFYSKQEKTCFYVIWKQPFIERLWKYEQQYFLINLFTKEVVETHYSESKLDNLDKFNQKIKELKWE